MMIRLALFASLALAACDGTPATPDATPADASVTPDAAPRATVTDTRTLQPGQLAEGTWNAGPGDRVVIHLATATADLDWNIHGHANGGTQTVAEDYRQSAATYEFDPTAQAEWWLLLRNSGTAPITVDVRMELYGEAAWNGWQ